MDGHGGMVRVPLESQPSQRGRERFPSPRLRWAPWQDPISKANRWNEQEEWTTLFLFSLLGCDSVDCAGSLVYVTWRRFWTMLPSSEEPWACTCFVYQASVFVRLRTHILVPELNLSYVLLSRSWDEGKEASRVGAPCSASSFTRPSWCLLGTRVPDTVQFLPSRLSHPDSAFSIGV